MLEKIRGVLAGAKTREAFFKRVSELYPYPDSRNVLIRKAYNTTKDAFREIKRNDERRYFEHLRRVSLLLIDYLHVTDEKMICAALLHDVVEDIPSWTIDRIIEEFGEEIATMVAWVTKPKIEGYGGDKEKRNHVYHGWFEQMPRKPMIIKLSDRMDNLLDTEGCVNKKIKRKIVETESYYLKYADKEIVYIHEMRAVLDELKQKLTSK